MKSIFFFLLVMCISGCNRYARGPLTMSRESYNGNQLNLNGMYLKKDSVGTSNLFLYRNGVVMIGFGIFFDYTNEKETKKFLESIKGKKINYNLVYAWGLFKVENQNISFETWQTGEMFDKSRTKKYYGKILNDTTFIVEKFFTNGTDTFRFILLPIKPDSTNRFIN